MAIKPEHLAILKRMAFFIRRIDIHVDMVLLPFVLMIFIAFVTVSYQTFVAAQTDPAKSLKTD